MKRVAVFVHDITDLTAIVTHLNKGWTLDPDFKIVRLENTAIYHLIKLSEEEQAEAEELTPIGKFDDVISIKSVPIAEADALIEGGYVVYETFSKTVTLIKHKEEAK